MKQYEQLNGMFRFGTKMITSSEDEWKNYLKFASRLYKYPFESTLLLYVQKPQVSMVATLPIWNKVGRYINKGEKAIAVCEYKNSKLILKNLFDVSQTNGKTIPKQWILDNNENDLINKLSNTYKVKLENLNDIIKYIVKIKFIDKYDELMKGFEAEIAGSVLSNIPIDGIDCEMIDIISDSAALCILNRCNIVDESIGFPTISHFDNLPIVTRLGNAISTLSKNILIEIQNSIKAIEKEKQLLTNEKITSKELYELQKDTLKKEDKITEEQLPRYSFKDIDVIVDENISNAKIDYSKVNIEETHEHTYEHEEV